MSSRSAAIAQASRPNKTAKNARRKDAITITITIRPRSVRRGVLTHMAPPIAAVGGHSVQDNIKIECIKYTLLCAGLFIWAPVLVWLSLDSGFRELWEYRAGPHMKERLFDALFIFFLVFGLLSMLGACAIVATYLRIKDLRVPSLHLIMVLSVADFFFALKYVLTGALVLGGHFNVQDDWWYSIESKRPARSSAERYGGRPSS